MQKKSPDETYISIQPFVNLFHFIRVVVVFVVSDGNFFFRLCELINFPLDSNANNDM